MFMFVGGNHPPLFSLFTNNYIQVAPNHTMTHVLNYALRQIMGPEVDQRGSSVTEERLRFDFSSTRGLKTEEIVEVETIVNEVISSKLNVNAQVVPLEQAMEINGLRAVFGEVYPDPVRVISVGPTIEDILCDPKKADWTGSSVEFCGGTHLQNTGDAEAFVVTEETAVAKGIRRISAITGEVARVAIASGDRLAGEVTALEEMVKSKKTDVEAAEVIAAPVRSVIESKFLPIY